MILRPYQIDIANRGLAILQQYGLCYIMAQVRTGKTLMALETARLGGFKNILFITKIRAFSSIIDDYDHYKAHFRLTVINKESVHKVDFDQSYDLVILDEAHQYGAYPKPGIHTKNIKKLFHDTPIIFLSGTPSPESASQLFHQLWISDRSPWRQYKNFYSWAKAYTTPKIIYTSYGQANDYSQADQENVMKDLEHLMITHTQEASGFSTTIDEQILYVDMLPITHQIADRLISDKVVPGNNDTIIADTAVALQQKLHQIYSGTCKMESGGSITLDPSKARFIRDRFAGQKIGIFYIYKQELAMLQEVYGDGLTTDLDEFNRTDKSIALQIVAGREGISLSRADFLVFLNISFSSVSYFQGIDRMSSINRKENKVFWIFSQGGIEKQIYDAVMAKKNYTNSIFKKTFIPNHLWH